MTGSAPSEPRPTTSVAPRPLASMTAEERAELERQLRERYEQERARGLRLDMTRGKPSPEQLDLSRGLLETVDSDSFRSADGTDCRNYGLVDGLPEARELFAAYLGVPPQAVVMGGNSSLALMHDLVVQALLVGVPGSDRPWGREERIAFLCPVPGYDRHFFLLERYGIEMIAVPLEEEGPAMEEVEARVAEEPAIKGMFCVPRYSNPTGTTYSAETVERLAAMPTAAPDFRIWWDDAYAVHHHGGGAVQLADALELAQRHGNPDRFFWFGSTSKLTYAGAGVSMVASSPANRTFVVGARSIQTIGPDKINQLRHVRFLRDRAGIEELARRHAEVLRPRFQVLLETLEERLGGWEVARWTRPTGGYFVSLDTRPGLARRVVELAGEAGVKLTPAGATWPHGRDPENSNLRLAPSLPPADEVRLATELLCDCVLLAALEQSDS